MAKDEKVVVETVNGAVTVYKDKDGKIIPDPSLDSSKAEPDKKKNKEVRDR